MKVREKDDDVSMEGDAELNSIEAAVLFATACHARQKDKGGLPYILHPLRVMLAVQNKESPGQDHYDGGGSARCRGRL